MAQVLDTFTVGANELLSARTPDTGTGYTSVYSGGTPNLQAVATTDACSATTSDTPAGKAYSAQPDPTVVEYDLAVTVGAFSVSAARGQGLFARRADNDNVYGLQMGENGDTFSNKKIFKRVGGVNTELAAEDTAWAANDVVTFEIRDATKKIYQNGTERASTTDNALTAAGTWGLAAGNFPVFGDLTGTRSVNTMDTFSCTEVAAGGLSIPVAMQSYRQRRVLV